MSPARMPVAYIAGPYRGATREAVTLNIQSARAIGLLVARKRWSPIVPHANTGDLDLVDPHIGDEFWLAATMELLRRADVVVLCPGWEASSGTLAEIAEAKRLGLMVYENHHVLPFADAWRQQEQKPVALV